MSRKYWSHRDHGLEPGTDPVTGEVAMVPIELTDDDRMTFGMYGPGPDRRKLGDIPGKYWAFLLDQPNFAAQRPQLARYARRRLNLDDNNKPKKRT